MTTPPKRFFKVVTEAIYQAYEIVSIEWNKLTERVKSLAERIFKEFGANIRDEDGFSLTSNALMDRERNPRTLIVSRLTDRAAAVPLRETSTERLATPAGSHSAKIDNFASFASEAVEVIAPAVTVLSNFVTQSTATATKVRAKEEARELVGDLLASFPLIKEDTDESKEQLKNIYGFLTQVSSIDNFKKRMIESSLSDDDKRLAVRFISSFSLLSTVDFNAYFSLSLDGRKQFHELYVDEVGEKMQNRSSVEAAADPLAKVLEADFLRRANVKREGPAKKRQAVDRTERLLYSLLRQINGNADFKQAKEEFLRLIPPNSSPAATFNLLHLEGTIDPLTQFFLNHPEFEGALESVLMTLNSSNEKFDGLVLLTRLFSSERHLGVILGRLPQAPEYKEADLGLMEKLVHIFAPHLVHAVFDKLALLDAPKGTGERRGSQKLLDDIIEIAADHTDRVANAENARSRGLKSVFGAFQGGSTPGLHPTLAYRTDQGADDANFRKHLKVHLGSKVLAPLLDTFLDGPMRQEILKEVWSRKEEILPLFVGQNRNIYTALLKLFKEESDFIAAGEKMIQLYRNKLRDQVVDLVMDKILERADPARMQSLILQKIAPPITNILRTVTLKDAFLEEIQANPERQALLQRYLGGESTLSPTIAGFLKETAEHLEAKGIHCTPINIQNAQKSLFDKAAPSTNPPSTMTGLGRLVGSLVAGLGLTGGAGWTTSIVSFFSERLNGLLYPLLKSIRDAESPLGEILSLAQPNLTEMLSTDALNQMLTGAPAHIQDDAARHQAMENAFAEFSVMLKILIDREAKKAMEGSTMFGWLSGIPQRISAETYQKTFAAAIEKLTDQAWKNENLLLLWIDALTTNIAATSSR